MILSKGNVGKFAVEWLEFYDMEKLYGDEKHQRKLLNRALNEIKDNSEKEIIYDLLIKFEKLSGNISQFNAVNCKYQQFKQQLQLELSNFKHKKTEKQQNKNLKKNESPYENNNHNQLFKHQRFDDSKSNQQLDSNNSKTD